LNSNLKEQIKESYEGCYTPCINIGEGDTLPQRAASEEKEGVRRSSEDLENDKPPPAPDQDLESSWFFQERMVWRGVSM